MCFVSPFHRRSEVEGSSDTLQQALLKKVHHYTPQSKKASIGWSGMENGKKKRQGRALASTFDLLRRSRPIEFLYERNTINAAYYCELFERAKAAC